MVNKKILKSIHSFTENQRAAPSFVIIYIVTWLVWHNQLFTHFINANGSFLNKVTSAMSSIDDNQYLVVFFLTCIIFLMRFAFNYLSFRSRELLNSTDDTFANVGDDQLFSENSDVANLMTTLTKTKQQLADVKVREKKAIADKTEMMKKLLSVQGELDEARADIDVLKKTQQDSN